MWHVKAAPSFSIQDDIALEFRSHQSKNAQNSTRVIAMLHVAVQRQQKTGLLQRPNKNAHLRWWIELICVDPLSPFSSYSQLRGVMRWGDLSPQRADQRCFEPSVPDFRGKKKKTSRTKYLMLNSLLTSMKGGPCLVLTLNHISFTFFPK